MSILGTRGIVFAVLLTFIVTVPSAWAGTTTKPGATNIRDDINPALRQRLEEEIARQEKERRQRLERGDIRVFKNKGSGVDLITNRVSKYRARSEYVEIDFKFKPIQVDPTYRRLRVTNQYTNTVIGELVRQYSVQWNLPESLVYAVIKAESNFQQDAISPAGARGLMQLMPGTAEEMGVDDPFDPAQNIAGGTQYLAKMLEIFDGDLELALAGYNAGPQTVIKCGRQVPNIRETQNYVRCVQLYKAQFEGHVLTPTFLAAKKKPRLQQLPQVASNTKLKTVYYHSGLTQPVEKVVDDDPNYYYLHFKGRVWSVPKRFVKEIV